MYTMYTYMDTKLFIIYIVLIYAGEFWMTWGKKISKGSTVNLDISSHTKYTMENLKLKRN